MGFESCVILEGSKTTLSTKAGRRGLRVVNLEGSKTPLYFLPTILLVGSCAFLEDIKKFTSYVILSTRFENYVILECSKPHKAKFKAGNIWERPKC